MWQDTDSLILSSIYIEYKVGKKYNMKYGYTLVSSTQQYLTNPRVGLGPLELARWES